MAIFWKRRPKLKAKTQTSLPDRIRRKVGLRPQTLRDHVHMQVDIYYSGLSLDQIKQMMQTINSLPPDGSLDRVLVLGSVRGMIHTAKLEAIEDFKFAMGGRRELWVCLSSSITRS